MPAWKAAAMASPNLLTVPSATALRRAPASWSTPSFSTGSTGVPRAFFRVSHALLKPLIEPLRLFCRTSAVAAALPWAFLSWVVRSPSAPMPWLSSARRAGPASVPTARMALLPAGPAAASSYRAFSKLLVVIPAAASSLRNLLAGSANWLRTELRAVPARLASMPASANLPRMATVVSRLRPRLLATGAA